MLTCLSHCQVRVVGFYVNITSVLSLSSSPLTSSRWQCSSHSSPDLNSQLPKAVFPTGSFVIIGVKRVFSILCCRPFGCLMLGQVWQMNPFRCWCVLCLVNECIVDVIQVILAKPRAEVSKKGEAYRKRLCNTHLNIDPFF